MHALKHNVLDAIIGTDHDDYEDDEDGERELRPAIFAAVLMV